MSRADTVGVIGTGLLGRSIAERLHAAGQPVTVFNRTQSKALPLQAQGIAVAVVVEDVLAQADRLLLLLADAAAIRSVLFSPQTRAGLAGKVVIQMGTIGADESLALQQDFSALGADYLEAPVLGSIAEAKAGSLLVMAGGTAMQFRSHRPLLKLLSHEPRHIGPVGAAATLKLALNQLIASETAAFALSLGLVQRFGLSADTFMAVLRESALFAPTFDKKLPRLLARDYERPNFSAAHLLKDLDLLVRQAARLGLTATGAQYCSSLLRKVIAAGRGHEDYSALYDIVSPPDEAPFGTSR